MKKLLIFALLIGSCLYAEGSHCDIREDNIREWDAANMQIAYQLGCSLEQIAEDYPDYSIEEIYYIVISEAKNDKVCITTRQN